MHKLSTCLSLFYKRFLLTERMSFLVLYTRLTVPFHNRYDYIVGIFVAYMISTNCIWTQSHSTGVRTQFRVWVVNLFHSWPDRCTSDYLSIHIYISSVQHTCRCTSKSGTGESQSQLCILLSITELSTYRKIYTCDAITTVYSAELQIWRAYKINTTGNMWQSPANAYYVCPTVSLCWQCDKAYSYNPITLHHVCQRIYYIILLGYVIYFMFSLFHT